MSQEEQTNNEGADNQISQQDAFKNMKEEFNRKISNIEASNQQLAQALNEQMSTVLNEIKSGTINKNNDEDLENLKYTDPDAYIQIMMGNLKQEIKQENEQQMKAQTEKQQTLQQLYQQYPEIGNDNSELVQQAQKINQALPSHLKDTAAGYKMAVLEAASNLGIVPASKRKQQEVAEEFVSSGSNSGGDNAGKKEKSAVNDKMLKIAELLGRPVNDKEYKKNLEKYANRKSWMKYK